jgi:hypothetical protein
VDVGSSLVADGEAAELCEPSQGPLDDPPVSPQSLAALDTAAGDPVLDATAGESPTTAAVVIGFVGVQLRRPFAWPSPALADWWDSIDDRLQHPAVVDVGACQLQREGNALRIGEDVTLRTRLAAIGRVRTGRRAPLLAAIDALSREARLKSMPFWRPSRSSSVR